MDQQKQAYVLQPEPHQGNGVRQVISLLVRQFVIRRYIFWMITCSQTVAPGESGQLCVSGVGLARGYLNRPELTAEKFIDNPFIPGEKLYCTGDYARWLPDGNIEYHGRTDHQVKIRGYRIELGEIEAVLQKYTGISEAAVIVKKDRQREPFLSAYYVAKKEIPGHLLRSYMEKRITSLYGSLSFSLYREYAANCERKSGS